MRPILLVGTLAAFSLDAVHCFLLRATSFAPRTHNKVAFIDGLRCALLSARKRPREDRTRVRSTATLSHRRASGGLQVAAIGSFVEAGRGAWVEREVEFRTREARRRVLAGAEGMNMSLHLQPPDMHAIMESVGRVLFWGVVGGLQMKYTKERLREKEMGLEVDERAEREAENAVDMEEAYVCTICDNANEIDCDKCEGKGFFVSSSAQPSKCGYCGGLGKLECPRCEERRERQRHGKNRRKPPLRLPPGKDNDFPFDFPPFNR